MSGNDVTAVADDIQDIEITKLEAWLAANIPGFVGPLTYTKFAVGQSNPTYRIAARSGSYVLRRKPFGKLLPSAHAIEREYTLLAALHPTGYPVAKPFALCEDESVVGSVFYVMEMVEGATFWDGALPGCDLEQRTAIYFEIVDRLAELHGIDYERSGLAGFGKAGNYLERQVQLWTRQYRLSQTEDLPDVEKLIDWLPRTMPRQQRTTIVHGDYRIDNLIFSHDGRRIEAVLDWELSTIGDPLADLSYFLINWVTPVDGHAGLAGINGPGTGIPTLEQMVARYGQMVGAQRDMADLNWYFAFCRFRQLGITQGIRRRFLDGNASGATADVTGSRVPLIAESAWAFAQKTVVQS